MTTKQIEVSILGQPYRLACSPETEDRAARGGGARGCGNDEGAHGGSVRGTDRIAVMAALSLASELLCFRKRAPRRSVPRRGKSAARCTR